MNHNGVVLRTAVTDAGVIAIFVIIGRSSHSEGLRVAGILNTWWPFAAGAALGWSLLYTYTLLRGTESQRHPFRPEDVVPAGLVILVCTVVIGMVLRVLFHQGIAVSFVIVATTFLALFLLGWRALLPRIISRSKQLTL